MRLEFAICFCSWRFTAWSVFSSCGSRGLCNGACPTGGGCDWGGEICVWRASCCWECSHSDGPPNMSPAREIPGSMPISQCAWLKSRDCASAIRTSKTSMRTGRNCSCLSFLKMRFTWRPYPDFRCSMRRPVKCCPSIFTCFPSGWPWHSNSGDSRGCSVSTCCWACSASCWWLRCPVRFFVPGQSGWWPPACFA